MCLQNIACNIIFHDYSLHRVYNDHTTSNVQTKTRDDLLTPLNYGVNRPMLVFAPP